MSVNPKISIIIPTLNSSITICNSIQSVINQTYNNFEIIIVDGLSNDDTLDKIKTINDQRIKISSQKDKGVFDAMNKGINLCSGDWIYFMGSDDELYSQTVLEDIFDAELDESANLIYGKVYLKETKEIIGKQFTKNEILVNCWHHQSVFYRKTVFNKIGVFNTHYPICADWEFNMRYCGKNYTDPKFLNMTIAKFSILGLSSRETDIAFFKDINKIWRANFINFGEINNSKFKKDWAIKLNTEGHSAVSLKLKIYFFLRSIAFYPTWRGSYIDLLKILRVLILLKIR